MIRKSYFAACWVGTWFVVVAVMVGKVDIVVAAIVVVIVAAAGGDVVVVLCGGVGCDGGIIFISYFLKLRVTH